MSPEVQDEELERFTTPAPARLVFMEATTSQVLVLGLYISAELRYAFPSWPPTANRYPPKVVSPTPPRQTFICCTNCQVFPTGSYLLVQKHSWTDHRGLLTSKRKYTSHICSNFQELFSQGWNQRPMVMSSRNLSVPESQQSYIFLANKPLHVAANVDLQPSTYMYMYMYIHSWMAFI